ncbi:MAG: 16S rRNA processing protein RimM [Deltaproteobacteria bacterium]|nr:16S rRNA processing protein RimM [Deltaproteobacteria bacterium]
MQVSKSFSDVPEDHVCFGYVSGIFGVKGEVRIFLYNSDSRFLFSPRNVFLIDEKGIQAKFRIKARTGAGKKVIARIDGVESRESAREKIGYKITMLKNHLPVLPPGEWYHHQLLGMKVHTESGEPLGEIVEIVSAETEIWICESAEETIYIPYTDEDVLSVSLIDGIVVPDE